MSTALLETPVVFHHTPVSKNLTYCGGCGQLSYEHEATCQRCGGEELQSVSQTGEIYSYTTAHDGDKSFVLALVELTGGRMVTARIVDLDREPRIGLPVRFTSDPRQSAESAVAGFCFAPMHAQQLVPTG